MLEKTRFLKLRLLFVQLTTFKYERDDGVRTQPRHRELRTTKELDMHTRTIKTAAMALAASGLALTAPASAAPAAHAAAWQNSAQWSDVSAEHGRKHKRYERQRAYSYGATPYYNNGYRTNAYPQQAYYGEPVYANTRVWQGDNGQYYCRKSNGTTGLLIGAAGGALLGREIAGRFGDRTLGAILGAAGGALLGRSIDKSSTRCR